MHPPPPPSRPPKLRPGSSVGKCRGAAAPVGPHRVHLKSSLATLLVDDQLARANSGCAVTYVYCTPSNVRSHMTPCFHQLLAGGI